MRVNTVRVGYWTNSLVGGYYSRPHRARRSCPVGWASVPVSRSGGVVCAFEALEGGGTSGFGWRIQLEAPAVCFRGRFDPARQFQIRGERNPVLSGMSGLGRLA